MKIYLIKSRSADVANPECFIKAESDREALRVFRRGFIDQSQLTISSIEELTWEKFLTIAPDEFMLCPNIEF